MRMRLSRPNYRVVFALIFAIILVAGLAVGSFSHVAAVAQGDATMVYGEGTVTTPRNRTWTQASTSWGAEGSGPAAAASIRHIVVEASPIRDEMIVGIQTTGGTLYIQRWNGSSWSNEWNVTVGNGNLQRFDIAYERNSGEVLVVYSGNVATTNELRYRVWNGNSWTAATNMNAQRTTGVVHAVKLASHVGALNNDIGLAWGDANLDLSANYWNGSANTWSSEPAAALSTGLAVVGTATALTNFCFDVALESSSGDMLVVWGNNAVQDLVYVTRGVGSGGSWGAATTQTAALEEPTDVELASDPNSDYIAYANITDNTTGADASTWTGTAWNTFSNFDTAIGTVAASTKNIGVSWLRSGSEDRAVVVYEDAATSTGVDWTFYNKNTNSWAALQTDFTTAPAPASNVTFTELDTNPFDRSQLMLTAVDSGSDVFAKRLTFNGTTFTWSSTEPSGVALETGGSSTTGYAADFAYSEYIPGPLTVDIVDGAGASVASPSVSMSAANVSLDCQTITGMFGTNSQKIRVNNATSTPGWTLTLAATSGNTAQWSSGTDQYDFNDSGGSPGGCTDSGDTDTQAGQLTINPAVGSLTPASGCTNTGLSLGAQSAFSQGTLDSLTIATASAGGTTSCYWDVTGITVSQKIPAEKPAGNYSINLTLTATSN
jgi:hypothetical protein